MQKSKFKLIVSFVWLLLLARPTRQIQEFKPTVEHVGNVRYEGRAQNNQVPQALPGHFITQIYRENDFDRNKCKFLEKDIFHFTNSVSCINSDSCSKDKQRPMKNNVKVYSTQHSKYKFLIMLPSKKSGQD